MRRKFSESGSYEFEWRKFYLRRLWRLYPAYAVSVVGTYFLLQLTAHGTDLVGNRQRCWIWPQPSYADAWVFQSVFLWDSPCVLVAGAGVSALSWVSDFSVSRFENLGYRRSIIVLSIISLIWRYVVMHVFHYQLISVASTGPYARWDFYSPECRSGCSALGLRSGS